MLPEEREIFICYFDLRKYSFLDKNFSISKQIEYLEAFHKIIERKSIERKGVLYHLSTDTCIYYFNPESFDFIQLLVDIKKEVDHYFEKLAFPCRLHISATFGIGIFAEINTDKSQTMNIFGNLMNSFQKTVSFAESELGKSINDRITLHESLKDLIEEDLILERNVFLETEFISLK